MKKPSRKSLVKKLDTITSLIIRSREKRCVQCGSTENLTNGHVLAGRYHSLRWDLRPDGNCHTQCWPDNFRHTKQQDHYHDWYRRTYGEEAWQKLRRDYYGNTYRFSDKELIQLIEHYQQIYDEIVQGKKTDRPRKKTETGTEARA